MTDPVRQSVLRTQWLAQLGAVGQRVGELAGGLRRPQLDWSPPDGGWGVGQVLEHLCVANDSYLGRLRSKLARAPRLLPGADPVWRPSLMGGWLARSLAPGSRRLPAPRIYRPAPRARPGVLEAFLHGQHLGDCFAIILVHEQRHLGQPERIRAQRAFPVAELS